MCLAVPGCVVAVYVSAGLRMASVDFGGVLREVCVEHVAEVAPDDYVVVHVGYALSRLSRDEANEIMATLDELKRLSD